MNRKDDRRYQDSQDEDEYDSEDPDDYDEEYGEDSEVIPRQNNNPPQRQKE